MKRRETQHRDLQLAARMSAALLTSVGLASASPAFAQSVLPGAVVASEGEEIVVVGARRSAMDVAMARAKQTAGGVSVIAAEDVAQQGNLTLSGALASAPGVVVQNFFGANDQPRVQIRGSGLQQNPVERGVLLMQDGVPLNRADGAYAVGLVDPRQAAFVEVFRGYTANRLGATVMGGAVNFVTPSGRAGEGLDLRAEVGSFDHAYGAINVGGLWQDWEASVRASYSERDGFREYNASERTNLGASALYHWNANVSTRAVVGYVDNRFDVSGPLNQEALDDDARRVFAGPLIVGGVAINPGPNVLRDRPQRDTRAAWAGARTTAELAGGHIFDFTAAYVWSDDSFRFPVSAGERVTEGGDANFMLRYAYEGAGVGLPLFEFSTHLSTGEAERGYYLNAAGQRGALFGVGDLEATTWSAHAEANLPWGDFVFSPGVSYARADRSFEDQYDLATRPTLAFNPANPNVRLPNGAQATADTSYDRNYDGVSFSLATTWTPNADEFVYLAWSQSFEPPTHEDLIAAINGTPNSSPGRPNPGNPGQAAVMFATPALEAQTANTLEIGWRGARGELRFDALAYYSWIENELLSLRDATGVSLGAINAYETRHFGFELGASAALTPQLNARIAYLYQDFHFVDDPVRGDNNLAGASPHVVNLDLDYTPASALTLGLSAHWLPEETPVDNLNTLYNDAHAIFDLRAIYRPSERWSVFVEGRNVGDETYASSTLVVDQARPDQAVYIPGDGRAVYAGLALNF